MALLSLFIFTLALTGFGLIIWAIFGTRIKAEYKKFKEEEEARAKQNGY